MSQHALKMYDYHVWANKTLFKRLIELSNDVYHQEIQSVFPSISKVVSHMYIVDQLWLHIISGISMAEALDIEKVKTEMKSIEEMEKLFFELTERFKDFLNQQVDMEKILVLDNPWAGRRETSLSEMVMHIVTHGTYHRGNITAMLHQIGHSSVTTDYTNYWFKDKTD